MKRHIKTQTSTDLLNTYLDKKVEQDRGLIEDKPLSDISIDGLLGDGLLSLYREMKNLLFASSKGKLSPVEAKDLRDTVKLLFELKDREKDLLAGLETDAIVDKLNAD